MFDVSKSWQSFSFLLLTKEKRVLGCRADSIYQSTHLNNVSNTKIQIQIEIQIQTQIHIQIQTQKIQIQIKRSVEVPSQRHLSVDTSEQ